MNFNDIFPSERLDKTEQVLRNFWKGEGRIVFSSYSSLPNYRQLEDPNDMLKKAEENLLSGANLPGFNMPRFIPDFGTVSTAAYWGGKTYTPAGGFIGIKPVIRTAEDALKVRPEKPDGGDAAKAALLYNQLCKNMHIKDLYCSFIDIQGPLNTAALLWEQTEFMMAMLTESEAVHQLLSEVTDQIIGVIKTMICSIKKMSGPLWPFIWLPSDIGVGITEDYMPLISADLYKEFGVPYVKKISDAFGGLFIHCCGEYEHQLDNLTQSGINVLGMEFHYPHVKPEVLFKAFGNSAVFVPYISPQGKDRFPTRSEYFRYLKEMRLPETRLWFILDSDEEDFKEQVKIIESMM